MSYLTRFARRRTSQRLAIPGTSQVPNSAGGYAWAIDDWARLRRFLILGSEDGSFYAGELTLTRDNATAVWRCVESDGTRAIAEIVAVSREGRAAKNDPAIFALAMAASATEDATRQAALASLPLVCRTSTHLFAFARYVEGFRGWGRSLRRGIATWYLDQAPEQLAHQAVKYRQRDGTTHRDVLRLAPGREDPRRQPAPARHGRARAAVRVDHAGRRPERAAADRRRVHTGAERGLGHRDRAPDRRVRPPARGGQARAPRRRRGVGGAARAHADDRAHPQPGDAHANRRDRPGFVRRGVRGRAAG